MARIDVSSLKSVSPAVKARMDAYSGQAGGAYRGAGSHHPVLRNWHPGLRAPHSALRQSREALSARLHDLIRNDGWAAAGTSRFLDNVVGAGFRLSAKPNWRTLGITYDEAEAVADQVEAMWFDFVNDPGFWCDVERMGTLASSDGLAVRHLFADGDAGGWVAWRDNAPMFATCLQVIDPVRISNPNGRMDTATCRDGFEVDEWGAWTGAWVRQTHPGELFVPGAAPYRWELFPRETEWGRPAFLHLHDRKWAGMSRSESDLSPVVTKLKQVTTYDDYEMQAAMLNSLLAAFVSTPVDPDILDEADQVSKYAQSEADYYQRMPLEMEGVSLGFLHPGSRIETVKAEHPHSNFEAFERNALRNVASAAGMSYEAFTADFSQANYSSIRAALVEFRKGFTRKSALVAAQWKQPFYMAWLEEVFERGLVDLPAGAPSFLDARVAWSHAKWIGPGTGWVDPQKEAEASAMRLSSNISTLEDEVAAQGGDWKSVIDQRARERKYMIERGLDPDAGRPEARIQSKSETTSASGEATPEADRETDADAGGQTDASAGSRPVVRRASYVPQIGRAA